MIRKLTSEEVEKLIAEEDECGMNTLLQELFNCKNPIVVADVAENGCIGFYDVFEKDEYESYLENELGMAKIQIQFLMKHFKCDSFMFPDGTYIKLDK